MAQTIRPKRNKNDASAVPSSLLEGELATNLKARVLYTNDGSKIVMLYTGEDKYFNAEGFANKAMDTLKLGGQLPSYYASAAALKTLQQYVEENVGGTGGGGGTVYLIPSWDNYDPDTMANYSVSGSAGFETHELISDVDALLDEVNSGMNDRTYYLPNDTIAFKDFTVYQALRAKSLKIDETAEFGGEAEFKDKVLFGEGYIYWDAESGKAKLHGFELPLGARSLGELEDVEMAQPLVDGQMLVYDANAKKFVNKVGSGGGAGPLLNQWQNYEEGQMENYGISAKLGYELHTQTDGVDSLLDEINGTTIQVLNTINGEVI